MIHVRFRSLVSALVAVLMLVTSMLVAMRPGGTASASEAGNPIVDGWYADPDMAYYNGRYWVFPTTSLAYDQQTYMDAFSSADLITWTKHPNVLNIANISWARRALWAPAPIARNGKYYLYFAANDIQSNAELGGIGVAVASQPQGPYVDAIGRPLIAQFVNGAQPIDQDVFIDDDGQAYMYYGGWHHANVVKLNPDMISLGTFSDGTTYKEITPSNYTEGSLMFKRNGKYYFMWSEDGWTGPNYSVAYAIASSPTGPFTRIGKVLAQDPAVARGSGHNTVINVPGTDTWYIFYHRRPLSETDGNHRVLAYDQMYFNPDGTIQPVVMTVRDNFQDNNAVGWRTYGGTWSVSSGGYNAGSSLGGKALLDTNFSSLVYEADVTLTSGGGDGGLLFRVTAAAVGADSYNGYYAGLSASGQVVLGKAANSWTQLATAPVAVTLNTTYRMKVEAVGSSIKVFVGDMATPKISVTDTSHASGANGVRVHNAAARFDNLAIRRPTSLALNKPATASGACNATTENAPKAVDGVLSTKWCDSSATKWLQVDLGSSQTVSSFTLQHAAAGGESTAYNTRAFNIQTSTDNVTWTTVVNVTANTANVSSHAITARAVRYVRLNVTQGEQAGNAAARIYELEVYGSSGTPPTATPVVPTATRTATPSGPTPTRTATPVGPTATRTSTPTAAVNRALNRPATSDSACNTNETAPKAVNGSVSGGNTDKWCSIGATKWLRVDLGASYSLTRFVVKHAGAGGESTAWNTAAFNIETSADGTTWTPAVTVSGNTLSTTTHTIAARSARYVRLNVTQGAATGQANTARIYELEAY